jgi:HEAT repeat protein
VIEDTLDWVAGLCGLEVPVRPSRRLRAAVRALGSEYLPERQRAESELCADRNHAAPLLREAARAQQPVARAVRAAVLLHRLDEQDGPEILRHMAHDPSLRSSADSELLRHAVQEVVGHEHYIRQAAIAVTHLEQRPESFKAIVRFRQAAQMLRFQEAQLPLDLIRRSLLVRTVGGEDLSQVRAVLNDDPDVAVEHVCMVRREAVLSLLRCREGILVKFSKMPSAVEEADRRRALRILLHHLAHPSPAVKLTAMYGLELLGDTRAISGLLPLTLEVDCPVREDARRLIEKLKSGRPDALTLLRAASPHAAAHQTLVRPAPRPIEERPDTLLRPPGAP